MTMTPEEYLHRIFGCELIQESGIILRLTQVVMVTGQIIFHRFLSHKSLLKFDAFAVAMGSVLLACKVEEQPRMIREILFAFHHIYQKRKGLRFCSLPLGGEQYNGWKAVLTMTEMHILKELGFSLYSIMDHPHKYILYYIKMLDGDLKLSQLSWNYLNDSLRLDLILKHPAQKIACASIMLAARNIGFPLPTSPPWYALMSSDIESVHEICESILSLYVLPKIAWLDPFSEESVFSPDVCAKFDRTEPPLDVPQTEDSESMLHIRPVSDSSNTSKSHPSYSHESLSQSPSSARWCGSDRHTRNDERSNEAYHCGGDGGRGEHQRYSSRGDSSIRERRLRTEEDEYNNYTRRRYRSRSRSRRSVSDRFRDEHARLSRSREYDRSRNRTR